MTPPDSEPNGAPESSPRTRTLFGTDGIRGRAGVFPVTAEVALSLGRAVTRHFKTKGGPGPRIVIGRDTRQSGPMLESAFVAGVSAEGGRALLAGVLPTPGVAHLTTSLRADAGAVISASHNPYEDNGIKLFDGDGFKLPDAVELELEARVLAGPQATAGCSIGAAQPIVDATTRYLLFAKSAFPDKSGLAGLKIVVDGAHGAAHAVAPALFAELGAEVFAEGCAPNGTNINRRVGALHPETLAKQVLRRRADLGVALDGDADRVVLVDERGRVVEGDALLALCALHLLKTKRLRKRTLAATVMSNIGLEHALHAAGGRLVRTAVGDRYVVAEMRKRGLNLGGESSGHVVLLDHATTGDGLVACLQVLSILRAQERPLSELAAVYEPVPQVLDSVRLPSQRPLAQMVRLGAATKRAQQALGKSGRVVVRWSGTEPKLRLMAEGPNDRKLRALVADMAEAAQRDMAAA